MEYGVGIGAGRLLKKNMSTLAGLFKGFAFALPAFPVGEWIGPGVFHCHLLMSIKGLKALTAHS
jgi:hypothetical protein